MPNPIKKWGFKVLDFLVDTLFDLKGVLGFLAFLAIAWFLGAAFPAGSIAFYVVWFAVPAFACCLRCAWMRVWLTLTGFRRFQVILTIVAILMSLVVIHSARSLENQFGKHCVEGHLSLASSYTEEGEEYYVETWEPESRAGRWAITSFDCFILAAAVVLPVITGWTSSRAVRKKEEEVLAGGVSAEDADAHT